MKIDLALRKLYQFKGEAQSAKAMKCQISSEAVIERLDTIINILEKDDEHIKALYLQKSK